MRANIVLLPGDGIGPEVITVAQRVLKHIAKQAGHDFNFHEDLIGGASIERYGVALTAETLAKCQQSHAVLLGAVGGPRWDNPQSPVRPEQGLLGLRKGLQAALNLRPVKVHPALIANSPLKKEILVKNGEPVDLLFIRELTGGIYFGKKERGQRSPSGLAYALDILEYDETEINRALKFAFKLAKERKQHVTSIDKANVLESSRLWRQLATDLGKEQPEIQLEHMLVDTAAMKLITNPTHFDVLVTENMFGDILTDEAAILAGSMGMLPSASLRGELTDTPYPGIYEPIHGSAPDIAGQDIANPVGTILSAALLLRYALGLTAEATQLEKAVSDTLTAGCRTQDLGGHLSTYEMGAEILARF